jgi:lysozyme
MMLKCENRVMEQLIVDEDVRLKPYYCPAGFLTVGVGRNLEGNGLSMGEMLALISGNPLRKKRFPPDYETLDGETLLMALIRDMKANGITRDEAMMLLRNDIYQSDADLRRKVKWYDRAPEELKEVLINMCFNMGIKTLLSFRNTLWYMGAGEYEKAAENMLKSKWARQVKGRATRLAERVRALK